jgi:hypothetical protein
MSDWIVYFKHIYLECLTALLAYFSGHIFFSSSRNLAGNKHFRFFVKTLMGYLLLLVIYAVIRARFNTVFLGALPLFVYYRRYFKHAEGDDVSPKNYWLQCFTELPSVALLIVFSVLVMLPWSPLLGHYFSGGDYLYYSGIADSFNQFGVESNFVTNEQAIPMMKQATFYHYGDIVGSAFLAWLWQIPASVAYIYVMLPFLVGLTVLGLFSWYDERIKEMPRWVVGLIVLIVSLLVFRTILQSPKLMVVGAIMVWFLLCYRHDITITQRCFPLIILTVFYPSILPPFCGSLLMTWLWMKVFGLKRVHSDWIFPLYLLLWFALFYVGNKVFFPIAAVEQLPSLFDGTIKYLSQCSNIVIQFFLCTRYTVGLMLYALGILVLLGSWWIKIGVKTAVVTYRDEFLLMGFALLAGYVGVIIFPYNVERGQPFMNLFRPLIDILLVIICGQLLSKKHWVSAFLLIISALLYCNTFSNVYWVARTKPSQKVAESLQFLQNQMSRDTYTSCYIRNLVVDTVPVINCAFVRIPFAEIRQTSSSFFPECLSVNDYAPDPSVPRYNNIIPPQDFFRRSLQALKNRSPFWYYYKSGEFGENIQSAQIKYIIRNKIDYLFVQDGNNFLLVLDQLPVKYVRKVYFDDNEINVWHYISFNWKE